VRWGPIIGLLAALFAIPVATGAANPSDDAEGSIQCDTPPTVDPDHGPPGTEVTVTADLDDCFGKPTAEGANGMECVGDVTGDGVELSFPMSFDLESGEVTGSFTAPATEPQPPVPNAIEPLTIVVSCESQQQPPPTTNATTSSCVECAVQEGIYDTTFTWAPANFDLELFSEPDADQPTLVTVPPPSATAPGGVIPGQPTFTG
jgi:hypothetical protein